MDTLQEVVHIAGWVAGHVAADPVIVDAVAHAEAVGHHGGEPPQVDGRAAQGAGGQHVVVDGGVCRVQEQVRELLPQGGGQVAQGKQVAIKALTWRSGTERT